MNARIVTSYAMKWSIPFLELVRKSMETHTATWSEFSCEAKAITEQILVSEERN